MRTASVMCGSTHSTIATLRAAVTAWRQREGWSRETVIEEIVATHKRIGGEEASGIRFEQGGDAFNRMRANAERVWRWLDDSTKDNNLLPANFMRSIIAALPLDLRLQVVDELLADSGLHATVSASGSSDMSLPQHLRRVSREYGEAAASVANLLDAETSPESLATADRELTEAAAAIEALREAVHQRRQAHLQLAS